MERFFDILSFAAGALFERSEFAGGGKNQRMSKNRGNERVFRGYIYELFSRLIPLHQNYPLSIVYWKRNYVFMSDYIDSIAYAML